MAYDLSGFVTKTQATIAAMPSAPDPKALLLVAKAIEATTPTVALSDILAASTSQQAIITAQGTSAITAINKARDDAIAAVQQAGQGSAAASGVAFSPTGGIAATNVQSAIAEVDSEAAKRAANLSDLADAPTARGNLGLGSAATRNVGTAAGNVPALDATALLLLTGDPTAALHAATKQYVDNLVQGLDAKASVRVASTGNLTLSGLQTIDGIAVAAGERVLVKDQTTTSQNGLYVAASGAWARAADADIWNELPSAFVLVESGTLNADTGWVCTSDVGGTLGTTAVTWVKFGTLAGLAALASPAFTGTPTAPTAAQGTNTTQLATLAFVIAEITARALAKATATQIRAGSEDAAYTTSKGLNDAAVPVQVAYSATVTLDLTSGFDFEIDPLTGNLTLANPATLPPGKTGTILLTQDATGGRSVSYGSAWKFAGGTPTASTAANAVDMIAFKVNRAGTAIRATFLKGFA